MQATASPRSGWFLRLFVAVVRLPSFEIRRSLLDILLFRRGMWLVIPTCVARRGLRPTESAAPPHTPQEGILWQWESAEMVDKIGRWLANPSLLAVSHLDLLFRYT